MKILGLGVPELVIILVVVLLIFGPKNLPKLGSALGKGVKSLRQGMSKDMDEIEEEEKSSTVANIEAAEVVDAPASEGEPKKVKRVVKKKVVENQA